jgi:UDP-N-acetylglucosamine/UDP-N-acetylgalactosamine diphosphorylase
MFVFDALPLARQALAVETSRREEFEPLKNAEGENSPATVRQALSDLFAGWLEQAGIAVARRPDGTAAVPIEISPLFALDAEELRARLQRGEPVTGPLLLEGVSTSPDGDRRVRQAER